MCNVSVPKEVNDVVVEFVNQGKVFTAYDVTVEARKRTSHNVRHSDVRIAVPGIINNDPAGAALYMMSPINLDIPSKGNPQVIVHHPLGVDPSTHPLALKVNVSLDPATPPVTTVDVPVDQETDADPFDGKEVSVTVEGRLTIPSKILSNVKRFGDSYDISFLGNVVSRIPDKDGRVRLGKKVIKDNKADKYRVSFNDNLNCIVVSAVTNK